MTGIESVSAESSPDEAPRECLCKCHTDPGFMHIIPCCQGRCHACGKWFESGFILHIATCGEERHDGDSPGGIGGGLRLVYMAPADLAENPKNWTGW